MMPNAGSQSGAHSTHEMPYASTKNVNKGRRPFVARDVCSGLMHHSVKGVQPAYSRSANKFVPVNMSCVVARIRPGSSNDGLCADCLKV